MENLSYEEALKELEKIVKKLEDGKENLASSIELFEKGTKLCAYCEELLEKAERKITELSLEE